MGRGGMGVRRQWWADIECSFLNATNEKALGKINLEDLKAFAVDKQE